MKKIQYFEKYLRIVQKFEELSTKVSWVLLKKIKNDNNQISFKVLNSTCLKTILIKESKIIVLFFSSFNFKMLRYFEFIANCYFSFTKFNFLNKRCWRVKISYWLIYVFFKLILRRLRRSFKRFQRKMLNNVKLQKISLRIYFIHFFAFSKTM